MNNRLQDFYIDLHIDYIIQSYFDLQDEYLNKGWKLGQAPKDRSEKIKKFKQTHYSKDNSQWKKNISNSIKNRRWVTNGVIDKQIRPEEIDKYLELGFTFGRCKIRN